MKHSRPISRRTFLGQTSCAAVGTTALFSTLLQLRMTSNAVAAALPATDDYRALVCIFLAGGNDSYNMLVPREPDEYADYAATRQDLALPMQDLLPIADSQGRQFGIHPGMPEIQSLYNLGQAAFLANVGTLVRPTTMSDVENDRFLPLGLYSHSDQIQHWQSSVPQERTSLGWVGRMADVLAERNNSAISMNISLSGSNVLQVGDITSPYTISERGSTGLKNFSGGGSINEARNAAINSIVDREYQHLFEQTFARITRGAIDAHEAFSSATDAITLETEFPDGYLGPRLEMIAKTIAARETLGMRRQTFFVQRGGWDHHDEVLNNQAAMLPEVSQAIAAFNAAMAEIGVANEVTVYTASDFGRTLTSNGEGSDHAWGGNHLIVGGGVRGGDIYGDYPESLAVDNPLDTGRGRLLPTTSVDMYNAELACWFGIQNDTNLEAVLPNIREFYSAGATAPPLGFMQPPAA